MFYTNLVGQIITAIPANDEDRIGTEQWHTNTLVGQYAGILMTIHTVAEVEGDPFFYATADVDPVYIDRPQYMDGYVMHIGKMYQLVKESK